MSNTEFKNRVYGCVVVKAINANYNADFSGLPRRLKSDGSFYATDKSFKWLVRNYIKKNYENENVLFSKKLNDKFEPLTLAKAFDDLEQKENVLFTLTNCIDVRLFGATFAEKDNNLSLHGTVQVNHATDLYGEGMVYTDEILSPFSTKDGDKNNTIGNMSKVTEAHYIHNFSINPKNLSSWQKLKKNFENKLQELKKIPKNETDKKKIEREEKLNIVNEEIKKIEQVYLKKDDISILKNAFNNAATFYDSHSKAGIENELSIYVTLNEDSTLTLPSFAQFITFKKDKEGNNSFDITKLIDYLDKYEEEIEKVELYYIEELLDVVNNSDKIAEKIQKQDLSQMIHEPEEEQKQED